MVKQTAGRDALHDFAPKFAELNDDVLFGEVWSREGQLPLKLRSIITICACSSRRRMRAAADAPPATPPTITTFILRPPPLRQSPT